MCVSASLSHLRGRTRPRKLSRYGPGRLFGQTLQELCLRNGPDWNGGPGRSRTADQRFRKPLLYPTELRGPNKGYREYPAARMAVRENSCCSGFQQVTIKPASLTEHLNG